MFRLLLLLLMIGTLSACSVVTPAPPPSTPQPPPTPPQSTQVPSTPLVAEVDPEEYALFSAMIDQNLVGFNQGKPVVIREQTSPNIQELEFALEGPNEIPEELVESYRLRNDQPYTLDPNFTLQQSYKLMPQSEYGDLVSTAGAGWADFEAKYKADGVLLVSHAGLNNTHDEALVSISYYCGILCVDGGLYLMVKEDGIWKVKQALAAWMA